MLGVAGNPNIMERLEVIRKLNAKREWLNDRLYGLTTKEDLLIAEEIKEKIGQFLKSKLHLTLSQEKTRITNARTEEAEFLGYRIRLGRSDKEQKVTKSTNGSGRIFARRATGFQVVLKAPIDKVIKRLAQKGFCDNRGNPTCRKGWANLDEDQIIGLFSSVNRGLLQFYRPSDNWGEMSAQLRTRSKLGFDCCIYGEENGVEMHHVRHVRKMSEKKAKGFMRIMAILNRKQIPVCEQCHRKIHSGKYDGLKLEDLAYDPNKPNGLDVRLTQNRNEIPYWPVNRL